LEEYKKGASVYFKPIKLPADYCRIIGTAGTPAINIYAVDLTFIDTVMADLLSKNILTKEEILELITTSNKWYVTEWNRKLKSKTIVGVNVSWLEGEGENASKPQAEKQHGEYKNPLKETSKDKWEKIENLLR
jgi:hypothetical protein